jgi:hypothetical protein
MYADYGSCLLFIVKDCKFLFAYIGVVVARVRVSVEKKNKVGSKMPALLYVGDLPLMFS